MLLVFAQACSERKLCLPLGAWLLLTACGPDSPRRVWQPEDHGQPAANQVDPSRVAQAQEGSAQEEQRLAVVLWRQHCTRCHGSGGQGVRALGTPNMREASWHQGKSEAGVARVIRRGKGQMPAFAGQIDASGTRALARLIVGWAGNSP